MNTDLWSLRFKYKFEQYCNDYIAPAQSSLYQLFWAHLCHQKSYGIAWDILSSEVKERMPQATAQESPSQIK